MKASPKSILVALEEVLKAASHVSEDEWIHGKVMARVLADLAEAADTEISDTELIHASLTTAYKALGVTDPYDNEKARANKMMLSLVESMRTLVDGAADPLQASMRVALAAAVWDMRTVKRDEVLPALKATLDAPLARDDGEALANALNQAQSILYFVGEAGEVVTDRLLIERLAKKARVTVVARAEPIVTEATREDCAMTGLDKIPNVDIIDTGLPMLGIWLERIRKELREQIRDVDIVISKGVYNCETLLAADREVYFFTPARGKALREALGVPEDAGVIARYQGEPAADSE